MKQNLDELLPTVLPFLSSIVTVVVTFHCQRSFPILTLTRICVSPISLMLKISITFSFMVQKQEVFGRKSLMKQGFQCKWVRPHHYAGHPMCAINQNSTYNILKFNAIAVDSWTLIYGWKETTWFSMKFRIVFTTVGKIYATWSIRHHLFKDYSQNSISLNIKCFQHLTLSLFFRAYLEPIFCNVFVS